MFAGSGNVFVLRQALVDHDSNFETSGSEKSKEILGRKRLSVFIVIRDAVENYA
jgi:hypothetical protein